MKTLLLLILILMSIEHADSRQILCKDPEIKKVFTGLKDGDTLLLAQGIYTMKSAGWIQEKKNIAIISKDGPGKAVIEGEPADKKELLSFYKCTGVYVEGLEIRNGGENLLKIGGCVNVLIKNCYIHNAHLNADCIKITWSADSIFSRNIVIQGCIVHTPGLNTGKGGVEFEENIDFMFTRNALVQDCWLFHVDSLGNQLTYPKGGCADIVYDRCLFGPQSTIAWDPAVGGGVAGVPKGYNVEREVVRNCLFINCHGGAVGSFGTKDFYIYNNTFFNCGLGTRESPPCLGIIHVKHGGGAAVNSDNIFIFNNMFFNDQGKNAYVFCTQGVSASSIRHDNNSYFNAGAAFLANTWYDPFMEKYSVVKNPYEGTRPEIPEIKITSSTDFDELVSLKKLIILKLCPPGNSAVRKSGIHSAGTPYPGVVVDILNKIRDKDSVDIGAYDLK